MGNYCCQSQQKEVPNQKIMRKMSNSSNSTTVSCFDSVKSMKKHSHKLLHFLQSENLNDASLSNKNIAEVSVVSQLGKGGQAKVFEVALRTISIEEQTTNESEQVIAVKRTNLIKQKSNLDSLKLAKKLLNENSCPFIIGSLFSFSCDKYLYSAMPIAEGGDLTSFLEKWRGKGDAFRKLGQAGIRFVLAGIVLGLEFLHEKGFIYCDLKTDNVLVDSQGYPVLSDFDLISDRKQIPLQQFQGTMTSVGPEIYTYNTIDKGIDLWALGILIHFLTYSSLPYTVQQITTRTFVSECQKKQGLYGSNKTQISKQLSDLINGLLKAQPKQRLGYYSLQHIKNHEFFIGFAWECYQKREIESPLVDIIKRFPIKSVVRRKTIQQRHKLQLKRPRKYTF